MTWTYDAGQLGTSPLMQARYLVGDVTQGKQLVQDEEITFSLGRYSTIYGACAEVCRSIATKFGQQVDLVQGELKTNYSQISRRYGQMATDFEQRGFRGIQPFSGGISVTSKNQITQDTDRVPPDFNKGQFDDLLPVSPVGQQTPTASPPDTDSRP
jgi:hypothetical protein